MIREVVDLNRISFEINLFTVFENDSKNIIFYNIFQMLVKKGTVDSRYGGFFRRPSKIR